jgi:hypothetical protein
MMTKINDGIDKGVYWSEDDRGHGPFAIRLSGTSRFVSKIDPSDKSCYPPGSVKDVEGWSNPSCLYFATLDEAIVAARQVWELEGFHSSVERMFYEKNA